MIAKVVKAEQACFLAREPVRNLIKRIMKVPRRDPRALLDLHTRPRHLLMSILLPLSTRLIHQNGLPRSSQIYAHR